MEQFTHFLVISDNPSLFETIKTAAEGFFRRILFIRPGEDYLAVIRANKIRVVLLDAHRISNEIIASLKKIKKADPLIDVLISGPRNINSEQILEIINQGATDYVSQPYNLEIFKDILNRISQKRHLRRDTFELEKKLEKKYQFHGLVSRNPCMLEIFSLVENIAKHFASVLITGETGTGKELIAGAIHQLSPFRQKKLVICDCTSIPENLFESEFFGYKKGAFTGADADKRGLFEEAHGGIILLDEIADVPLAVQAKLLRVLETQEFRPLGAAENKRADVRIIAATNRSLSEMVRNGQFREDLYHRLNKVTIDLPPLRERLEDVLLLTRHFLQIFNERFSKKIKGVSRGVHKIFLKHHWPGNVRELKNVLENAVMLCEKDFIDVSDLPKYLRDFISPARSFSALISDRLATLDELEKDYISYLLKLTGYNLKRTSELLGISRTTLYNKMRRYNLEQKTRSKPA